MWPKNLVDKKNNAATQAKPAVPTSQSRTKWAALNKWVMQISLSPVTASGITAIKKKKKEWRGKSWLYARKNGVREQRGEAADNAEKPKFKLVGTSPIFKKRSDSGVRLLSNLFVFSLLNFIGPPSPHPTASLIICLPVKHENRTEGEKCTFIILGALLFLYLQITAIFREQNVCQRL